jgi:hypothetical protein
VFGVASAIDPAVFCCLCFGRGSRRAPRPRRGIDVERHALLCSTLTRLAQRIGIDRRAKNITPSLSEYLTPRETAE